jgi:hypothetical protein
VSVGKIRARWGDGFKVGFTDSYGAPQLSRWRFERLYARRCARLGPAHRRERRSAVVYRHGLEARHRLYVSIRRAMYADGRPIIRTTNGQRALALAKVGHGRSVRTVQYQLRDLERMGLIIVRHIVKSGPARVPGELDLIAIIAVVPQDLRVACRYAQGGGHRPPCTSVTAKTALIPPPAAAETIPRAPPELGAEPFSYPEAPGVSEDSQESGSGADRWADETEAERSARFAAMWKAAGQATEPLASPRALPPDSDDRGSAP